MLSFHRLCQNGSSRGGGHRSASGHVCLLQYGVCSLKRTSRESSSWVPHSTLPPLLTTRPASLCSPDSFPWRERGMSCFRVDGGAVPQVNGGDTPRPASGSFLQVGANRSRPGERGHHRWWGCSPAIDQQAGAEQSQWSMASRGDFAEQIFMNFSLFTFDAPSHALPEWRLRMHSVRNRSLDPPLPSFHRAARASKLAHSAVVMVVPQCCDTRSTAQLFFPASCVLSSLRLYMQSVAVCNAPRPPLLCLLSRTRRQLS